MGAATGAFLRSVLCVRHDQFDAARANIERARGGWGMHAPARAVLAMSLGLHCPPG